MKNALVIKHLAFEDLGNLESVLIERGYHIRYIDAGVDDFKAFDPLAADLLVILGGPIGVYEVEHYPFLSDEINFIKARLYQKLPTLGICLGAQLIAQILGGKVYPGHAKEIGWSAIELTTEAQPGYFSHLNDPSIKVLHWHGDTFDLPPAAVLLASSSLYPHQAFRVEQYALGLQFHLEVLPANFERWLIGHACELAKTPNIDIQQLRQEAKQYGNALQPHAICFWHTYLDAITN